jgi:hypothetical protein
MWEVTMLELLALIGLFIFGLAVFTVLALVFGLLKIGFKLLLLPLALAWGVFKVVLVCGLILLALVLAPALLAVLVVVLPVLALAGVLGLGWVVVT